MNIDALPGLELHDAPFDGEQAGMLIAELQQEYVVRYGGPDETPVDPREFDPPDGLFVIAELDGEPAGCAGLRRHDDETVELKRMYVRAGHRRRGLARTLLRGMEARALALGYRRLVLETGTKQPEAIALYRASGYEPYESIGFYAGSEFSRCFSRLLR